MQRKMILGFAASVAVVGLIGLLVMATQQGWFGGRAQQLYAMANNAQQREDLPTAQEHLEELISTFPDSPWTDDAFLKLGEVYEAQQLWVEARNMYRTLLERFPDSPLAARTQARLGQTNITLLFSPIVTEMDATHEVKPGDTLGKIANMNKTTVEFLKRANNLKSDVIRPNQRLKVPKGRFNIVVDKSLNQLLLTQENQFVKIYPVATGKENSTPVGTFKIVTRIPNPVWYKQGAVVPPESPENILGTRWLGIEKEGYGIHGSVDPDAIGQQVTAGCVRMNNSDVEELFDIVAVGTEVTIVD
ncbi:MAG: L,D-transpeptidase family protein [Candidatus Omnitrophica bacterium]|nr:L,D-transpeptidase family protein [Candidatus Omnitrophota bacterium]MBI2174279.1 L,D-transpeptidase family protein [Candidatus Omnitrophota bacterium]MBI3010058.1 L,D-transpeptidase family protein [Candidatus Omnitrophota bacterium]